MKKKTKKEKKSKGVNSDAKDFFFDDCPICRATKKAMEEGRELSLEELEVLFKEANNKKLNGEVSLGGEKTEILETQKEIEDDFRNLAKRLKVDLDFERIKHIIYEEEEQEDMMDIVAMFDRGGGAEEMSEILELATDAWNYFPHRAIGGLSPAEMLDDHKDDDNKSGPIVSPFV